MNELEEEKRENIALLKELGILVNGNLKLLLYFDRRKRRKSQI
jgi:hypothetical protein